jgi:hypothetical protein
MVHVYVARLHCCQSFWVRRGEVPWLLGEVGGGLRVVVEKNRILRGGSAKAIR